MLFSNFTHAQNRYPVSIAYMDSTNVEFSLLLYKLDEGCNSDLVDFMKITIKNDTSTLFLSSTKTEIKITKKTIFSTIINEVIDLEFELNHAEGIDNTYLLKFYSPIDVHFYSIPESNADILRTFINEF